MFNCFILFRPTDFVDDIPPSDWTIRGFFAFNRIEGLRWMGLVCTLNREGVIEESDNMAALGAAHGSTQKWKDLELPLADFFVGARAALRRFVSTATETSSGTYHPTTRNHDFLAEEGLKSYASP